MKYFCFQSKLGGIAVLMTTAISPSLVKIGLKTKIFHQHAKFWQQDSFLNCGDSSIFLSKIWIHFWYIYVSYDWKFLKVLKRILVLLRTCSCVKNDDANSEKQLSSVENIGQKSAKCKLNPHTIFHLWKNKQTRVVNWI